MTQKNIESYPVDAWRLLSPRLTPKRKEKFLAVSKQRSRHFRLVIQDVHHPHNVSACLRSAEAFGLVDVDVVTLNQPFKPSTVARGVSDWLDIHHHGSVESTVESIRSCGYKIAAAFPDQSSYGLADVPTTDRLAVVFGNEHEGVHDAWRQHIDYSFSIPMVGFVESLNISVSCAITLYELTQKAKHELDLNVYLLNDKERNALLCKWICQQYPSYEKQLAKLR